MNIEMRILFEEGEYTISFAIMLVLCSGLTHAVWNIFTKTSKNKSVFLWFIHITAFALLLPYFLIDVASSSISISGYLFMLLTMGFQMGYFFLLPIVYRQRDVANVPDYARHGSITRTSFQRMDL